MACKSENSRKRFHLILSYFTIFSIKPRTDTRLNSQVSVPQLPAQCPDLIPSEHVWDSTVMV